MDTQYAALRCVFVWSRSESSKLRRMESRMVGEKELGGKMEAKASALAASKINLSDIHSINIDGIIAPARSRQKIRFEKKKVTDNKDPFTDSSRI